MSPRPGYRAAARARVARCSCVPARGHEGEDVPLSAASRTISRPRRPAACGPRACTLRRRAGPKGCLIPPDTNEAFQGAAGTSARACCRKPCWCPPTASSKSTPWAQSASEMPWQPCAAAEMVSPGKRERARLRLLSVPLELAHHPSWRTSPRHSGLSASHRSAHSDGKPSRTSKSAGFSILISFSICVSGVLLPTRSVGTAVVRPSGFR